MLIHAYYLIGVLVALIADTRDRTDQELVGINLFLKARGIPHELIRGSDMYRMLCRIVTLTPVVAWPLILVWKAVQKIRGSFRT